MAFSAGSSSCQSSEINVTPLIDVLLVLLILFMVIGPVPQVGLDSQIPQGAPAAVKALPPVVLRVLAGDNEGPARFQIGMEHVASDVLASRLRAMFAVRQDRTIFIEADRRLSYRAVATAAGEARAAGAGAIVLSSLRL